MEYIEVIKSLKARAEVLLNEWDVIASLTESEDLDPVTSDGLTTQLGSGLCYNLRFEVYREHAPRLRSTPIDHDPEYDHPYDLDDLLIEIYKEWDLYGDQDSISYPVDGYNEYVEPTESGFNSNKFANPKRKLLCEHVLNWCTEELTRLENNNA